MVTVVVVGVVLAPAVWPGAEDDFPLSTYPMFTAERGRVVELDTVVLVRDGQRLRLSPEEVGGTDEVVGAAVAVDRAVAAGPVATARLCDTVAERVEGPGTVEVVTEHHDAVAFLRDEAPPLRMTVHHRCRA
jgi:hypothetical protein